MKVGIHFEPNYDFGARNVRYEKILNFNQIETIRISSSEPDFMEKVKKLDAVIWPVGLADASKQPVYDILPVIEKQLKIPCFPSCNLIWSFDNKLKQVFQMTTANFPIIKSWIAYEEKEALRLVDEIKLPVIFKLAGGAGSSNVIKINNRKKLFQLTKKMFNKGIPVNSGSTFEEKGLILNIKRSLVTLKMKILKEKIHYKFLIKNWSVQKNYLFLQKFLPNNDFDTRIMTIGSRAFAYRRFNRPNDFRASSSGLNDYNMKEIDIRCVQKALEISNYFGFETMAYDFLYDENNEPFFCEYSYGCVDVYIYKCQGFWDENLNIVEGHFWPQYFHLMDLLKQPDLKHSE